MRGFDAALPPSKVPNRLLLSSGVLEFEERIAKTVSRDEGEGRRHGFDVGGEVRRGGVGHIA